VLLEFITESLNWRKALQTYRIPVLLLNAILLVTPAVWSNEVNSYVRVNQLGYETGHSARAFLVTKGFASGANFSVANVHTVSVSSAPVGPALGSWGNFTVYALDFIVTTPGTYSITVTGTLSAESPDFRIDSAKEMTRLRKRVSIVQ
jgi:hypothetical protein